MGKQDDRKVRLKCTAIHCDYDEMVEDRGQGRKELRKDKCPRCGWKTLVIFRA